MNRCLHCSITEGEGQENIYTGKIAEGGVNFSVFLFFCLLVGIGNFGKPGFETLLSLGM